MVKKSLIILFFLSIACMCFSCSIFKYTKNNTTYFCGNEDWTAKDTVLLTFPPEKDKYGYILLGWEQYFPDYPQQGLNSEGLCFDWATVPGQTFSNKLFKKKISLRKMMEKIMENCKDVDEAIKLIKKYNFSYIAQEHIMITDKNGASCVIEYSDKEKQMTFIMNNSDEQYVTNFLLTNHLRGNYPCDRYRKMKNFFEKEDDIETKLVALLDKIHSDQYTIYSYVFDLTKMNITLFYNHNFDKPIEYDFSDLILKKDRIAFR